MHHIKTHLVILIAFVLAIINIFSIEACTRILYETGNKTYIVGRSMDWNDLKMTTDLWIFPQGMKRDGGVGEGSISWTSKYGSIIASIYDMATVDGMNEVGLAGNALYLAESDYGDPDIHKKPKVSIGAWLQYLLDNYRSVDEVIKAITNDPFTVVTTKLPNGRTASAHISISDPTGDSAILEYIDGKLKIHHGRQYKVMTNSPTYDQQIAINSYWDLIGGNNFLPGTITAADRFVRASYALKSSPKFKDRREAVAAVFSQMRAVGVPLGMSDPDHPNISSSLWRTIIDHEKRLYYFDSVINPSVIWVDFNKIDLRAGATPKKLEVGSPDNIGGEVSSLFKPSKPFNWISP